jgi:hypothetical protein
MNQELGQSLFATESILLIVRIRQNVIDEIFLSVSLIMGQCIQGNQKPAGENIVSMIF